MLVKSQISDNLGVYRFMPMLRILHSGVFESYSVYLGKISNKHNQINKVAWPQIWHQTDGADIAMKVVLEDIQLEVRSEEHVKFFFTLEGTNLVF